MTMARVLVTSGPTRQHLDPVRFLSNGSSGKMGRALVEALVAAGHEPVVVTGPVCLEYPGAVRVERVVSTEEMLEAAAGLFPECEGLIGAAAPCDYRPVVPSQEKLAKTGKPLRLELIETPDIVATLAQTRRDDQWVVGFALETRDHRFRALAKAERKRCDLMVVNRPSAMNADENAIDILHRDGRVLEHCEGPKFHCARRIVEWIERECRRGAAHDPPVH